MNTRRMAPAFKKYASCATLVGLALVAMTSKAVALVTLSAGTVSVEEGQAASVPITMNTGGASVLNFAATFTVTGQGAAEIVDELGYEPATPPGPPALMDNSVTGSVAIGYPNDINPPLIGNLIIGTLLVPIPEGATGSYQVLILNTSALDVNDDEIPVSAVRSGTVIVQSSAPAANAPPLVGRSAGGPPAVEGGAAARSNEPRSAPAYAPPAPKLSGNAPVNAVASPEPTPPGAAATEPSPQPSPVVSGTETSGKAPPPTSAALGQATEAGGTSTRSLGTPTAAKSAAPAATATKKVATPKAAAVATPEAKSGCQIGVEPSPGTGGWLLMALVALFVARRRRR